MIPQELPAQRHYLVIVNPKSGPGRSLEIFLHRVRPILAEADISHLLLVTGELGLVGSALPGACSEQLAEKVNVHFHERRIAWFSAGQGGVGEGTAI